MRANAGLRIDPESGNASQPQFCLLPGFLSGFLCPRTSPAITQQQAQASQECPSGVARSRALENYSNGLSLVIYGPATDPQEPLCHVNAKLVYTGSRADALNWHIYWTGSTFVARAIGLPSIVNGSAGGTAFWVVNSLAAFVAAYGEGDVLDWGLASSQLDRRLNALQQPA